MEAFVQVLGGWVWWGGVWVWSYFPSILAWPPPELAERRYILNFWSKDWIASASSSLPAPIPGSGPVDSDSEVVAPTSGPSPCKAASALCQLGRGLQEVECTLGLKIAVCPGLARLPHPGGRGRGTREPLLIPAQELDSSWGPAASPATEYQTLIVPGTVRSHWPSNKIWLLTTLALCSRDPGALSRPWRGTGP